MIPKSLMLGSDSSTRWSFLSTYSLLSLVSAVTARKQSFPVKDDGTFEGGGGGAEAMGKLFGSGSLTGTGVGGIVVA
eukprot:CAMPEP_0204847222 /NCGR_PEP_ID=MMETSP1347-20130617/2572_1 /ASSEMBLY_ACC=CAM_ASM_000690 /TAXON_ID=215587 /ORGANISM="Aplanochytrium stocchinoi, Strain GSBS06" /LENGTH=76 /DNA_ID=CAMNT_0051988083 /DNA_START=1747 /DNA_END=1973 /DNA_ORIENTATION=+